MDMILELTDESGDSPWEIQRKQRAALDEKKGMAIIKTASIAFAARGYHDTSMDEIAAKLGIFKPTLYKFYKSKLALFEACVRQAVETWLDAARRAHEHKGTAAERLEIYLRRNFEFCSTEFGRALQNLELKDISADSDNDMREMRSKVDRIFRSIIRDGIANQEIDEEFDPKLVSFALFGSFNFVSRWFKADGEMIADEILDQYFKIFFRGLNKLDGHGDKVDG
jgi:AcrR family transcriptional regulator